MFSLLQNETDFDCVMGSGILIIPVPRHAKALFSFSVMWHWCNQYGVQAIYDVYTL